MRFVDLSVSACQKGRYAMQESLISGRELGISPRRFVRSGIQASVSFMVTERVIYGTRYIFCVFRGVLSDIHGIEVKRQESDGGPSETVMTYGDPFPKSRF